MPADNEVKVNLTPAAPGNPGHAVPNITNPMKVGQTVHYSSPNGAVVIEFVVDGTPFVDANGNDVTRITSQDVLPLKRQGTFTCHCFITLASGVTVGWDPANSPMSGGIHVVN